MHICVRDMHVLELERIYEVEYTCLELNSKSHCNMKYSCS